MWNENQDKHVFWLLKELNRAIKAYHMIQSDDHIAVAVSGGKDSLCLLELLHYRNTKSYHKIRITALHISGDTHGPFDKPHQPLVDWFEARNFPYRIEALRLSDDEKLPMNCQRCTWNRRRTLFEVAKEMRCNVIALGHHKDDFAQTTLMNILYQGRAETMDPCSDYFDGVFRLIRPMVYIREQELVRFQKISAFPSPLPDCPQSQITKRQETADLISELEIECNSVSNNLLRVGLSGMNKLRS